MSSSLEQLKATGTVSYMLFDSQPLYPATLRRLSGRFCPSSPAVFLVGKL